MVSAPLTAVPTALRRFLMADRLWRAQVSHWPVSLVPEDFVVNTLYFDDDDDPVAGPEDTGQWITDMIETFFRAIDGYQFTRLDGNADVKIYDMADPEPRSPVFESTIGYTCTGGDPLPAETALCLSYAATTSSGQNAARRRGRIFIGMNGAAGVSIINGQSRPSLAYRQAVATAAGVMADGFEHPGSPGLRLRWAVHSPTTLAGGANLGDSFHDVASGWVDDAWDTQRRRGPAPTARVTF